MFVWGLTQKGRTPFCQQTSKPRDFDYEAALKKQGSIARQKKDVVGDCILHEPNQPVNACQIFELQEL